MAHPPTCSFASFILRGVVLALSRKAPNQSLATSGAPPQVVTAPTMGLAAVVIASYATSLKRAAYSATPPATMTTLIAASARVAALSTPAAVRLAAAAELALPTSLGESRGAALLRR